MLVHPTVMLSSTARDLPAHRKAACNACLQLGFFPSMMEHLPASDASAVTVSLGLVDEAEIYLGIFAYRYGYIPTEEQLLEAERVHKCSLPRGVSITELEYRRATDMGRKRLIFLVHEDHRPPWREQDIESGSGAAKLQALLERLGRGHTVAFFRSAEELQRKVEEALLPLRSEALRALHQLPRPVDDFVDRREELSILQAAVEQGAALICGVHGLAGVGKTELVKLLAQDLLPHYPDAQFWVDMRGTEPRPLISSEAMAQVLRACDLARNLPEDERELEALYRSTLHGQRALIVLDNVRDAAQVERLLPPRSCLLLITSRWHFALPGLRELNLDTLPHKEAAELLHDIAPRLSDEQARRLAECCGYLALALRLAGGFLSVNRAHPVERYLRRLRAGQEKLTDVEASLQQSGRMLGLAVRQRWYMLSVFPYTFDGTAAGAVWGIKDAEEEDQTQNTLDTLLSYSLLDYDDRTQRYRLHDLVRAYTAARLRTDAAQRARARHAAHYESILRTAGYLYLQGHAAVQAAVALYDRERPNIEAGQAWAAAHAANDDEAARLCSAYPDAGPIVRELRQHPQERIRWLEPALEVARRRGDRQAEGVHLANLGRAYADQGATRRAMEYYEQALRIAREIPDRREEGQVLVSLGRACADQRQTCRAVGYFEQALRIAREIGDRRGEGQALGSLGSAFLGLSKPHLAIQYHEQRLIISREIGDRRGEGADLGNLGKAYGALGDCDLDIKYQEQRLVITREIGDRRGEDQALGQLGVAYYSLGEWRRAIESCDQALQIASEIGDRQGQSSALWTMSRALDKIGNRAAAISRAEQALAIMEQIRDPKTGEVRQQLAAWRGEQPAEH